MLDFLKYKISTGSFLRELAFIPNGNINIYKWIIHKDITATITFGPVLLQVPYAFILFPLTQIEIRNVEKSHMTSTLDIFSILSRARVHFVVGLS